MKSAFRELPDKFRQENLERNKINGEHELALKIEEQNILMRQKPQQSQLPKQKEKDGFAMELNYSGNTLSLGGNVLGKSIPLIKIQARSSGVLFRPIFNLCKNKPNSWTRLTLKNLASAWRFDKTEIESNLTDFYQFTKYTSHIGLKKPIRELFIGSVREKSMDFRLAITNKEWNDMGTLKKEKIVKYLEILGI